MTELIVPKQQISILADVMAKRRIALSEFHCVQLARSRLGVV